MPSGFFRTRQQSLVCIILLFMLALLLVACSDNSGNTSAPGGSNSNTNTGGVDKNGQTVTTPASPKKSGVQPCPVAVSTNEHWDPIVPTQPNINKVESVICGNLTGEATLQALVSVRAQVPSAILDVYIYQDITSPNPRKLFMLQGLYKGEVKISAYNTVMTGEVDLNSRTNTGKSSANYTLDLFREFKWSDRANTLVPINFPGIYPVLSRYEAEDLQQQVNQGNQPLLDASKVALNLATDQNLLGWSSDSVASVDSGGGKSGANAVVTVKNGGDGNSKIKVSLSRLEGNTNGGIWIVTSVTSDGLSISTPVSQDIVNSPVKVSGQGGGSVQVLDHLYNEIGSSNVSGQANFSTSVDYKKTFQGGAENGLVVLYGGNTATATGVVMVKELLG